MAVLIISCPCALALATPAAITAATGAMLSHGVAVLNPSVIETLAKANAFIFDKTGTLTTGDLVCTGVTCAAPVNRSSVLEIARRLSVHSEHPIGRALCASEDCQEITPAQAIRNFPGEGIAGVVAEQPYWLGSEKFIQQHVDHSVERASLTRTSDTSKSTYLANADEVIARFTFRDDLRDGAHELLRAIKRAGQHTVMISGDVQEVADAVAQDLGIDEVHAGLLPEEKLKTLQQLQKTYRQTVVIGDGINDAPMLAQALVSIAVSNASDLAKQRSDLIVLRNDLYPLQDAYEISRKTMGIIRQNMLWAIAYNSCALPLAVVGVVAPWLAALGMSLSSLLVVLNATRINKR